MQSNPENLIRIIEDSPNFIGMSDLEGNLNYHNKSARRMLGYPVDAELPLTKVSQVHPVWAAQRVLEEGVPCALANGHWEGESAILRHDGREMPVWQTILVHRDATGVPQMMSTIIHDISAQKLADNLEKHRSQVLQRLVDGAPLGSVLDTIVTGIERIDPTAITSILLLDQDGRHLLTGASPSLPAFYNDAIHGMSIGEGRGSCGTAAATGARVIVEEIATHPYWEDFKALAASAEVASCWSEPIRDSQQRVLGTFAIYHRQPASPDESDFALIGQAASLASIAIERWRTQAELEHHRHHLEEMVDERSRTIQGLNHQLEQRAHDAENATREKSELLASMSHEIRSPLNAIIGLTHLMQRTVSDPAHTDKLAKISTAGHHLLSVINDILDFSKIETGNLELEAQPVELRALASNVVSILEGAAQAKGIALRCEPGDIPRHVLGDATRLTQAFLNLANNAVKFTDTGSVTLRIRVLEAQADTVCLRFEVIDTWVGIAPELMSRLFQSFQQADASTTRRYGGTGLGLAITRRLAELMGGTAGADSVPGEGSTFWFSACLKTVVEAEDEAPAEMTVAQSEVLLRRDFAGTRVLLVDDEPFNQLIGQELLEEVGLVVDVAGDGVEAVERMRGPDGGDYALILMDMQMPNLDGPGATRQIRELPNAPQLPILAMTANAFGEDRERCLASGMNDFITKPVDPEILYARILKWLAAETLTR